VRSATSQRRGRHPSLFAAATVVLSCWPACKGRTEPPAPAAPAETAPSSSPLDTGPVEDAPSALSDATSGTEAGDPAIAPCSGPGYGPGPELRADAGALFITLFNCLWPSHQRMEMSVALTRRAKRKDVEGLLHGLWKDLEARMGKDFPETAKLCVFAPGSGISDTPLGCIRKGYEPEGEPGEEEADLRIDMRPEPAELAEELTHAFGKRFVGSHRPRATFDQARAEITMAYPYLDGGTDRWSAKPSYVDVVLPFFAVAWEFYPPKSEVSALTFVGASNGKTLLRVHLRDLKAFLAMDPWAVRQRLGEGHVPYSLGALGAPRTPEQSATLRREFEAALAKLPAGSVALEPSLP
jgi:hypothetical protein